MLIYLRGENMKDIKFFVCKHCGKIIKELNSTNSKNVCCGEEMQILVANSVDASVEKHVPVVEMIEDELLIKIGSTLHPMTKEHYIQWVIVKNDDRCYEVELFPEQDPVVRVPLLRNATVYAYCNLHGLWKTEIK